MLLRCKQFGFDRKNIDQRLAFLKLSKADHKLAHRLKEEVIIPNANKIIDRFYDILLFQPETRKWLLEGTIIERLKSTQYRYLLSLGIDFDTEEYFENRLQIGIMHAVIDLPLSAYQCAYCNLIQCIADVIPESIKNNGQDYRDLMTFITKITSLDISLATETYHYSFMSELEEEVKMVRSRESKLRSEAETDSLTGLYNRKLAFNLLNEAIANAHQYSGNLSLLMLDLDFFKKVNDTYGHQVGDEAIKQVATAIRKTLRGHDIAGRYGGEEFILGLVDITPEIAFQVAQRIRKSVAKTPILINEQITSVTVSIGLASLEAKDNLQSLIRRSDAALYLAKEAGRNCVIIG